MTIGIGGAGGKLACELNPDSTIVNVSEAELNKLPSQSRILATVHSARGQMRGSRKDPQIGRDAFFSVKEEMLYRVQGELVFCATGGGTGNGIVTGLLAELSKRERIVPADKTLFALILPYAKLEPAEFVDNTIEFLQGPISEAIDSGNTGNIYLYSNRLKFESRASEAEYNQALLDSLRIYQSVPDKGDEYRLLEGHIDHEDFALYNAKPYFNHYTSFQFDPTGDFEKQFQSNMNPYLLPPENPIEALFLLEVPPKASASPFYDLLEYYSEQNVTPVFGVVENPNIQDYFITVSVLYSRKPMELVEDFNQISHQHTQAKVRKSLEQHVPLPKLQVNLENETKKEAKQRGANDEDVLKVLRRLGKI